EFQATARVHLPGIAADKGLVNLNGPVAAHLLEGAAGHRLTNPMEHEPCGLLRNAKGPCEFVAADAVLAVDDHPHGGHPLIHAKRGILEDGPDLHGELLFAALAEPDFAGLQKRVLIRSATGAVDTAIRPA